MATLPGQIISSSSTLLKSKLGFDTATIVSLSTAQAFYNSGYSFCLRYLSLGATQASGDLSYNEAYNILQSGLALMAVQHVRYAGWTPSATLGTTDGTNAVNNAKSIGLPTGVSVWCDLEGVSSSATAQSVIDYCNSWYDQVYAAGYVPGVYVGANCGLTGDQLYYNLKFSHYWKSASTVPNVTSRGYQMVQSSPDVTVNGIRIDKDTLYTDNLGGEAKLLIN